MKGVWPVTIGGCGNVRLLSGQMLSAYNRPTADLHLSFWAVIHTTDSVWNLPYGVWELVGKYRRSACWL